VDRIGRTVDIRKGPKMADVHPTSVFEHKYIGTEVMEDSIFATGEEGARGEPNPLVMRLLRADPPLTTSGSFAIREDETATQLERLGASRWAYLTGYNPESIQLEPAENVTRQQQLSRCCSKQRLFARRRRGARSRRRVAA
jgi:hypothetical protein